MIAADNQRKISVPQMLADSVSQLPAYVRHRLYRIGRTGIHYPHRLIPANVIARLFKVGEKPQRLEHRWAVLAGRIARAIAAGDADDHRSTGVHAAERPWYSAVEE